MSKAKTKASQATTAELAQCDNSAPAVTSPPIPDSSPGLVVQNKPRHSQPVQVWLQYETVAAQSLVKHLSELGHGDDDSLVADTIEGQTNLDQAIEACVNAIWEDEANIKKLKDMIDQLQTRKDRLAKRTERSRVALAVALETAKKPKYMMAQATLSLADAPRKVEITDETQVPLAYMVEQDPTIDKKELLKALKEAEAKNDEHRAQWRKRAENLRAMHAENLARGVSAESQEMQDLQTDLSQAECAMATEIAVIPGAQLSQLQKTISIRRA